MNTAQKLQPQADEVICEALFNAKNILGITQDTLGSAIGLDRSSIYRTQQRGTLDPNSKAGELALYLIRIYRSLYAIVGGDSGAMQHWMHTHNLYLHGTPAELIRTSQGLVNVMEYLDAMRGKI